MRHSLHALPALLRLSLAVMFQYRVEILIWAVWSLVYPAIGIAMWGAAVAGREGGPNIHGYGSGEFAAYFLLTMIVGHLCTAWDVYEMGHSVRSGAMSPHLLRPMLPVWGSLADNIAFKALTTVVMAPIWVFVAIVADPIFTATPQHLLIGVPVLLLAMALNFLWGYVAAMSAFWITRTDAVGELWMGCSLFLGGRIGPMAVLPGQIQWIATVLPFKWVIWFPSATLTGQLSLEDVVRGLYWQLGWLILGIIAFHVVWHFGIKRYSAVGA